LNACKDSRSRLQGGHFNNVILRLITSNCGLAWQLAMFFHVRLPYSLFCRIKQEHSEREIRTRTVAPFSQAAAVVAARAAAAASQLHTTRNDISSLLQSHSELNGPCAVVQVGGAKWQGLVNVPETSTVAQLKIRIGLISAIAPRVQELIYRGRKLSDPGVALHSLGIRKNKRSRVLLRARRSINSTCT